MTRRSFLALMAGLALFPRAAFALEDGENAPESGAQGGAPFDVIVANDLHYLARELTDNGEFFMRMAENGDGKVMRYSEELVEAFICEVIERRPDALILAGDLTFNGERVSHERLAEKLSRVADAGVRVLALPGNHDLNMRIAASFSGDGYTLVPSVTADEFCAIYGAFGYDGALSRDAHSLSYLARLAPGVLALLVDVNGVPMMNELPLETLAWIDEQLAFARQNGERVIAVSHQNLLRHNEHMYTGFTIDNAAELLARYEAAGVALSLSGHIHMQHIAVSESGLPDIATSSLAVSPNQYGVLNIYGDRIEYATRTYDIAAWAAKNGSTDPDLLDFPSYSAGFFKSTQMRQTIASVAKDEDPMELAGFMADVSAAYFAGRMDLVDLDPAMLKRWAAQGTFFAVFLDALVREAPGDCTKLTVRG